MYRKRSDENLKQDKHFIACYEEDQVGACSTFEGHYFQYKIGMQVINESS
jgi:hypothetical protein